MLKRNLFLILALIASTGAQAAQRSHIRARRPSAPTIPVELSVGPALGVSSYTDNFGLSNGVTLPGAGVSVGVRVTDAVPLYVGADMQALFHAGSPFGLAIPVLPAAYMKWEVTRVFRPMIGVSAGPVINVGSYFADSVDFGLLFKPGASFYLSRDFALTVEPRLGIVAGTFAFDPQISATFSL